MTVAGAHDYEEVFRDVFPRPGTPGIESRVTQIREMDPVTPGPNQYPNGYVAYMHELGQRVNPLTGRGVQGKADPFAHIELPG